MKIRPLEKTDRSVWEQFMNEYAVFYKTSIPEGGHQRVWDWIFDNNNDFWCDFVLDDEGKPLGFTQYQLMHRSLSGEMVCYLSDLYVKSDTRGTGAGRALIDHVIDFAQKRKISNVRWLTQDYNYAGRRLYDSYVSKSDFILYSLPV